MVTSTVLAEVLLILGLSSQAWSKAIPRDENSIQKTESITSLDNFFVGEPQLLNADVNLDGLDGLLDNLLQRDEAPVEARATRPLTNDERDALKLHNTYRAKKEVKPLVWDSGLAADAKKWAAEMAKTGKFAHSPASNRTGQGENLAYAKSSYKIGYPETLGTEGWVAEISKYHNEIIPKGDFASYGHYTQVMWNTTTKVGIATVSDGKGAYYTCARYSPAGNIAGRRPY